MTNNTDVEITPKELSFRFQLSKSIPSQLILYNKSVERQAFKIKTTSPKKYCVRPASGFIEGGGHKTVEVIMQAQKEYPSEESTTKDKFLILTTPVSSDDIDLTSERFDKALNPNVQESKVRVILELPRPPETIAEHPQEESGIETVSQEEQELDFTALKKQNIDFRHQVERLERQLRSSNHSSLGFSVFHLLMVAVLAFLIGHYLQFRF